MTRSVSLSGSGLRGVLSFRDRGSGGYSRLGTRLRGVLLFRVRGDKEAEGDL